jgi:hypothetical protein
MDEAVVIPIVVRNRGFPVNYLNRLWDPLEAILLWMDILTHVVN